MSRRRHPSRVPAEKRAAALEVYDAHGSLPAQRWAGVGPHALVEWVRASGRPVRGRGHPTRAELIRQQPRPDCTCPMCLAVMEAQRLALHRQEVERRHAELRVTAGRATPDGDLEEPWRAAAACRTEGPALWFSHAPRDQKLARELCSVCPVREPCLEYALVNQIDHGIWGGESERRRRRIARQLREAVR